MPPRLNSVNKTSRAKDLTYAQLRNTGLRRITMEADFELERYRMIEEQLKTRDIRSAAVLNAMFNVPRHLFVPENMRNYAYDDSPMPIGWGQTISQPYIVAYMTEQLEIVPGMKILEIGTGSGYQAAILAYLGCEVYSIELLGELVTRAKEALAACDFESVKIKHGNGYSGWQEEAPFDAIIVTAAPEYVPDELIGQLKEDGKMIIPVGGIHAVQSLRLITKKRAGVIEKDLLPVRFVPMVK